MFERRLVALLALFVLACGNASETPTPSATPTPSTEASTPEGAANGAPTTPATEPAATGEVSGDETACVRAEPCCHAFVEAIGDEAEANRARAACESLSLVEALGDAADDACANAIAGWREALVMHEREVSAACADSVQ
jgi:hypothetical protein